jgi:hypothetical protein
MIVSVCTQYTVLILKTLEYLMWHSFYMNKWKYDVVFFELIKDLRLSGDNDCSMQPKSFIIIWGEQKNNKNTKKFNLDAMQNRTISRSNCKPGRQLHKTPGLFWQPADQCKFFSQLLYYCPWQKHSTWAVK